MNSTNCKQCNGCQWQSSKQGEWCYMFETEPSRLPCAQHDQFEVERQITQTFLRKHPQALLMLMNAVNKP